MAEKKKKGVATKTKPKLWARIVAQVKSENIANTPAGKWSARKSQIAIKRYKAAGGGYKGKKSSSNSMSKWNRQQWTTSSGKNSDGKRRYLPKAAWKRMSKKDKAATNRKKAADTKKGKGVSRQPKKIAKQVRKYRK